MNFLEKAFEIYEPTTYAYNCTERFLPFLFGMIDNNDVCNQQIFSAVNTEIELINKKTISFPGMPKIERNFEEFNIEFQSGFFLATRIANLNKALYIITQKYENIFPFIVEIFKHNLNVLQEEFKEIYGTYYNEKIKEDKIYIHENGQDMSFSEYLIYNDLFKYFKKNKLKNSSYYEKRKWNFFSSILSVYLNIELAFFQTDFNSLLDEKKRTGDFIGFYNYVKKSKEYADKINQETKNYYEHGFYLPVSNDITKRYIVPFVLEG